MNPTRFLLRARRAAFLRHASLAGPTPAPVVPARRRLSFRFLRPLTLNYGMAGQWVDGEA